MEFQKCKVNESQEDNNMVPKNNVQEVSSDKRVDDVLQVQIEGASPIEPKKQCEFYESENCNKKHNMPIVGIITNENETLLCKINSIKREKHQLLMQCEELIVKLNNISEEKEILQSTLLSITKSRDLLNLRCQELETKIGILEAVQKEKKEVTPKKAGNGKTNSSLKKLGLTEDILLSLPFGYATKIRSAFEKLHYENEKLQKSLDALKIENTSEKDAEEETVKFETMKQQLTQMYMSQMNQYFQDQAKLQIAHEELKIRYEDALRHKSLISEALEVSQIQIQKLLKGPSTINDHENLKDSLNNNADSESINNNQFAVKKGNALLQFEIDILKERCFLLSKLNTAYMIPPKKLEVATHMKGYQRPMMSSPAKKSRGNNGSNVLFQ